MFQSAIVRLSIVSLLITATAGCLRAQTPKVAPPLRPPEESRARWIEQGRRTIEAAKARRDDRGRAKNVILFVGDGMGVATVTAARILDGQLRGSSGEESSLSFERFPHVALSKTYSVNQQTSDSAPTMTALITGVKTNDGFISVDQSADHDDPAMVAAHALPTLVELAEAAGLSTGIVSTARLTHATPAACYAHVPDRSWECDADLPEAVRKSGFHDIAVQLLDFPFGDGPEVALGGGRDRFLPRERQDPEEADETGARLDGRDLMTEWSAKRPRSVTVWNEAQFDAVDPKRTDHLLGLFDRSHMEYERDRGSDAGGEPALHEMTAKAIDILSRNSKGFVLVVEGGRIDHAHHGGNAYHALTETIELARAVETAVAKTNPRETLVLVTADHSHVFTIAGYPTRGNDILGKARGNDEAGRPAGEYAKDKDGRPYTTLGYANGPGIHPVPGGRPDLTDVDTTSPTYRQDGGVPLSGETHGGEDVPIYATGPGSYLVAGVLEENVVFHVLLEALGLRYRELHAERAAPPRAAARGGR